MSPPGEDGKTPVRPIRVTQDLWERFGKATKQAKTDRSAALRAFMHWYAHDPGAKMPRRPEPAPEPDLPEEQPDA